MNRFQTLKPSLTILCVIVSLAACASNLAIHTASDKQIMARQNAVTFDSITIPETVPFSKNTMISPKIKQQCRINKQLADYVESYAKRNGYTVTRVTTINTKAKGNVLTLEIVNALSVGNLWSGHMKTTQVKGSLYRDGSRIGSFTAQRSSSGGAFSGFKGSCSVLGRTVKVLGKDIANWINNPADNMHLGE